MAALEEITRDIVIAMIQKGMVSIDERSTHKAMSNAYATQVAETYQIVYSSVKGEYVAK